MKKIFQCMSLLMLPLYCMAQLEGVVIDSVTKEKIPGAIVTPGNSYLHAVTDETGAFSFPQIKDPSVQITVSHLAYETRTIQSSATGRQEILLSPKTYMNDEVMVTATRASEKSPTAFTMMGREEIANKNLGQDFPFLLNTTPSVVVTSDAGNGVGYTGIHIRGSDLTRVNVTINGVPVNDAEEHGVFWVDLPDFASSVSNVQVQRGIGTSTNGAGAFGASVNILSSTLSQEPFATLSTSAGSFNTWKSTLNFGTGLLKNKIAVEGRLSKIKSDGFVDRGSSDLKSFYLSGGYFGRKSTLRAIVFSGKEKTYQSWNGVPEAKLRNDRAGLVAHYYNNYGSLYNTTDDSLNLFNSDNRTFNGFTYKNQTDNYQQDYYQLHYSFAFSNHFNVNAALHYTKGKGYYEEFKNNQPYGDYSLVVTSPGMDTTDLIRQKWLDNDFYGFTLSSNYETEKIEFTAGAAGNQYDGRHFDQVIWTQQATGNPKDFIYGDNDALKNDFNVFAKMIYHAGKKIHLYGDLQYRMVTYSFQGFDASLESAQQDISLNFFNPKAGITFDIFKKANVYVSYAAGNKEPIRGDYVNSSPSSQPKPEHLQDVEAGFRYAGDRLRAGANFFYMDYKDQLILTGQINDVGAYTRMNVDKSFRSGIELEAAWSILKSLSVAGNVTLSAHKIKNFVEYVDDYDAGGQQMIAHANTDIAFSPPVISSATISWMPVKNLSLDFISKYVGKQFLDNTSNEARKLDAYSVNDLLLTYRFRMKCCKEIALKMAVYNLFSEEYESNGYTYGYIYGGQETRENFYFPQAGLNWLGGVELKF